MPLDPSIYSLQKQPDNPLDQYGKALNLRALMDQSRLQNLQTGHLEKNIAREDATDALFANAPTGATLESLLPEVYRVGGAKQGVEFQGKLLTQQKTRADLEKTQMELTGKAAELHRESLSGVDSPQAAAQWVQAGYADPRLAPILSRGGTVEQALARIPTDQTQFQQWKAQNGMGIQKFLEMQNTNAQQALTRDVTLAGQKETARHNAAVELHNSLTAKETGRHHLALEGDPQTIEDTANAIAKGQLAPLSGFALSRPMAQNIMARVVQINPDFDPTQFATRQKAEKDFATGKQGTSVKSFNVAISHLGTLDQLADALNNGNVQLINKIGNAYATQSGGTAPTDFNAAKKIVADEIVKAIVGSGGGVHDREEAAKTIDAANSPAQLKGVIKQYKELMKGQLDGLRKQYEATTGKSDFDKKFLSEAAQGVAHGEKPKEVKPGDQVKASGKLVPAKGAVQDGYRFKGGDPAKPESWEKV
jgi:hypothetical protein